jgi:hypothetical protein
MEGRGVGKLTVHALRDVEAAQMQAELDAVI